MDNVNYETVIFRSNFRAGRKSERKKLGVVNYSTDRENQVSKIFIIFLGSNRGESSWFMQTRLISASRAVKSQARPSA